MHELSLAQALLEQVHTLMREHQAGRVTAIRVSVGEFSGVEPELLRSACQLLMDTPSVRGADLQLERVPLQSRCNNCGREFVIERFRFSCPTCSDRDITVLRGEELVLESVTFSG